MELGYSSLFGYSRVDKFPQDAINTFLANAYDGSGSLVGTMNRESDNYEYDPEEWPSGLRRRS